MLIPVDLEEVGDFIVRARDLLAQPETHVYVDTSLAMWLTAIGPTSREAFFLWAETLGDRIHVPTWTLQEYFKHHKRRTQVKGITDKCADAEKALNALGAHMRVYADGALVPDKPEMAFVKELESASDSVSRAIALAKTWDYDSAASAVIGWLNSHALGTTKAFDSFAEMGRRGGLRYAHEVPPGFEDRRKKRNRYGDLLFWGDVVEDVRTRKAGTGVILTRDRKSDWFFSTVEPEPDDEWKRLNGRWNPVPVAHPLLTLEMRSAAAAELLLIDDLYLSAVMWSTDKVRYGRLAAVAFGMSIERLAAALAPPPSAKERALRRSATEVVGIKAAKAILDTASAAEASVAVTELLAVLDGEAPEIEAAIAAITPEWASQFPIGDLTVLARKLYEAGLAAPSAGEVMASRLLDCVDRVDAEHASAIVAGMLVAAYFDQATPRARPVGPLLQTLFAWRFDAGVERVLSLLKRDLKTRRSAAIFLPSPSDTAINLEFAASASNVTVPAALGQIFVGTQPVLVNAVTDPDAALLHLLGDEVVATVDTLIDLVATYYGIPRDLLESEAGADEMRTIVATIAFKRFSPIDLPARPDETPETASAEGGTAPSKPDDTELEIGAVEEVMDEGPDEKSELVDDETGEDDADDYEDEDEDDLT